ncbi:MAG: FAD-dependent monooxygenase [Myxococcota bacterium]
MDAVDVLVVGAGPTGLSLAVELARRGVAFRVVDAGPGPSVHSKALVIQPRTLEVFSTMGVVDEILRRSQPVFAVEPREHGKSLGRISFADDTLDGPFSRPVMLRQAHTEAVLLEHLAGRGVTVQRRTELVGLEQDAQGVTAIMATGEQVRARYLVGCDGSHSRVRQALGLTFEGSTYENDFIQVDCKVRWPLEEATGVGFLRQDGVMACLPLGQGVYRFIRIRQQRPADAPDEPRLSEFQEVLDEELGQGVAELFDVEWIIRFRLHERMVDRYRVGRAFVAGDAAHIHTPAGGQGMNTGIQDVFNLAWKLELVLADKAGDALLDSYHLERHPVAADVLRATDFLFRNALAGTNSVVRTLRSHVLPMVLGSKFVTSRAARMVSQLEVNVRKSPIVEDARFFPSGPHAGDRAPDAKFVGVDGKEHSVFAHLRGKGHVLFAHHVRTDQLRALTALMDGVGDVVVADEGDELLERYHLGDGPATWVVRPDGYIGHRQNGGELDGVKRWLEKALDRATT